MEDWLQLLISFFISNVLGYGGGPASIPLMYKEIVTHHGWLSDPDFSNMLASKSPLSSAMASPVGWAWRSPSQLPSSRQPSL